MECLDVWITKHSINSLAFYKIVVNTHYNTLYKPIDKKINYDTVKPEGYHPKKYYGE